jgi:hypothetical protein
MSELGKGLDNIIDSLAVSEYRNFPTWLIADQRKL